MAVHAAVRSAGLSVMLVTVTTATVVGACTVEGGSGSSSTKPPAVTVTIPTPATRQPDKVVVVPNVVGKDHQVAQDTMQAAGFYHLTEEDATGQGRMLILDHNWVVVEQRPKAGTRARSDATILLRSKKKTDP
jgi:PASTA domain